MNTAYLEARALLQLRDTLGNGGRGDGVNEGQSPEG